MFDADAAAGVTDDLLLAAGDPGFHADPGPDAGRQDRVAVGRVLGGEPFHAWHLLPVPGILGIVGALLAVSLG
jgi:hypothetical protein